MEFEIQSLLSDLHTAKRKVVSLERDLDMGELERLKLDEELLRIKRKCEDLEETVTRLNEDKKMHENREKRAKERCEKISAENSKMSNDFHNSISELNETIKQLENKNVENERLIGVFQEKYEGALVRMGQEIEDLKHENLKAVQTIEELRCGNIENKKTIEELKLKYVESNKLVSVYKSRLEDLSPRIKKIEGNFADMLNIKVGDLGNLANNLRELTTNSKDTLDFKGKDDDTSKSKKGNWKDDDTSKSKKGSRKDDDTPKSKKADKNSDHPLARGEDDDSHNTVKNSPGSQLGRSSPQPESNGFKTSPGSGAHASGKHPMAGEGCCSKIKQSSSVVRDIVEIVDSDDEANPAEVADNMGDNEMRFFQSPSCSQRSKKRQKNDLFSNSSTKRKRNMPIIN